MLGEVRRAATLSSQIHCASSTGAFKRAPCHGNRFVNSPYVGNVLETPPSAATLGIKLEDQGFGVSSVHASLVMFINVGIRLTKGAGENPWR